MYTFFSHKKKIISNIDGVGKELHSTFYHYKRNFIVECGHVYRFGCNGTKHTWRANKCQFGVLGVTTRLFDRSQ